MKLNINKNTTKMLIGLGAAFVGAVVGTIIDEESSEKTFTKITNYYDYKIAREFADFGILTPDGYGTKDCNYYDYKIVKAFCDAGIEVPLKWILKKDCSYYDFKMAKEEAGL